MGSYMNGFINREAIKTVTHVKGTYESTHNYP